MTRINHSHARALAASGLVRRAVAWAALLLVTANVGGSTLAAAEPSRPDEQCPTVTGASLPTASAVTEQTSTPAATSTSRTAQTTIRPSAEVAATAPDGPQDACILDIPVPGSATNLNGLAFGADGNLWSVQRQDASQVWRMVPRPPYTLTAFPVPTQDSYLIGIAAGRDGELWFTEQGDFSDVGGVDGKVGRISAFPPYTITEFGVPSARPRPLSILSGPDGNVWFTEYCSPARPDGTFGGANKIARLEPHAPYTITEFPLPTPCAGPASLTVGPDGNLWFVEINANQLGRIRPTPPYTITEFPLPPGGAPISITAGPDHNLWFTERPNTIGRISPVRPDSVSLFPVLTPNSTLNAITIGPDGDLYFSEFLANKVGRFSACSPRRVTEIDLPPPVPPFGLGLATRGPNALLAGHGDALWFAEPNAGAIGRLGVGQLDEDRDTGAAAPAFDRSWRCEAEDRIGTAGLLEDLFDLAAHVR